MNNTRTTETLSLQIEMVGEIGSGTLRHLVEQVALAVAARGREGLLLPGDTEARVSLVTCTGGPGETHRAESAVACGAGVTNECEREVVGYCRWCHKPLCAFHAGSMDYLHSCDRGVRLVRERAE